MWVNMGEVEENMFMNEYSHTIDSKGRMILPTKFREELGNVFILAPGLDQCLCIYPKEKWDSLIAKLQKLPFTNQKVRKIRFFTLFCGIKIITYKIGIEKEHYLLQNVSCLKLRTEVE